MRPIQIPTPNHGHFDGATERMNASVYDFPTIVFIALLVESVDLWFNKMCMASLVSNVYRCFFNRNGINTLQIERS